MRSYTSWTQSVLLKKIWHRCLGVQGFLLSMLLFSIVVVTLANVLGRYIFGFSIPGAGEYARLGLVVLTFLGGTLAVGYHAHLRVDALSSILRDGSAFSKIRSGFLHIASACFFLTLFIAGSALAIDNLGKQSPALGVSMGLVYLALPISASLMTINYLGSLLFGPEVLPETQDVDDIQFGLDEGRRNQK